MEQRNTIVKCNATNCLFNYKGICDNYVISLDAYGQCNDYCETGREAEEPLIEEKIEEENTPYVDIPKNCDHCQHRVYGLSHPYCELHNVFIYDNNSPCSFFKPILRGQRTNIAGIIDDEAPKEIIEKFKKGIKE